MHPAVVQWFADAAVALGSALGVEIAPLTDDWVNDCQRILDIQAEMEEERRRKQKHGT